MQNTNLDPLNLQRPKAAHIWYFGSIVIARERISAMRQDLGSIMKRGQDPFVF